MKFGERLILMWPFGETNAAAMRTSACTRWRVSFDRFLAWLAGACPPTTVPVLPSIPRPIAPQRLQREALADRAEGVALDDAG